MSQTLQNPQLASTVDKLSNTRTENVVPPPPSSEITCIPPFPQYNFPKRVLLVIPTANQRKIDILLEGFGAQKPPNVSIQHIVVPAESAVGEQPYDRAGVQGAWNRIANALQKLSDSPGIILEKGVGVIIAASIENYIQRPTVTGDGPGGHANHDPVDYGVVMVHNATTGQTATVLSPGVTVPRAYFDYTLWLDRDNPSGDHGTITVGQVLAANVHELDEADWHAVVAGKSRYDLLREAIGGLRIPW